VVYTSELTGPQFPAGIREPLNSGPSQYTDLPCTLTGGGGGKRYNSWILDNSKAKDSNNSRPDSPAQLAMCQYSRENNNNNALPLFFGLGFVCFFRGRGPPWGSPDLLSCWHPVYMLCDKTWIKPDRVIASLKYGKRTHQRNPADIFYHLSNT
jgi:hypothetical protein